MKSLPSYIKDTSQLINELRELSAESDTFLVTIDVTLVSHIQKGSRLALKPSENQKRITPLN